MKLIKFDNLKSEEKKLLRKTRKIAKKTLSKSGDMIGALIIDENNHQHAGAAICRMRAISSTCAERMALDSLLFSTRSSPKQIYIMGNIAGNSEDQICTPCGDCRQMFQELCQIKGTEDLDFVISSWNEKNILKIKLSELFPAPFIGEKRNYKLYMR